MEIISLCPRLCLRLGLRLALVLGPTFSLCAYLANRKQRLTVIHPELIIATFLLLNNSYLHYNARQSSPVYTDTSQSRGDTFLHFHNHIFVDTCHHSNPHCRPLHKSFPGNQQNKGIFRRLDHMIHFHGNMLDTFDHSWSTLDHNVHPSSLDHKYSCQIPVHNLHGHMSKIENSVSPIFQLGRERRIVAL